jgi:hypothetical protein
LNSKVYKLLLSVDKLAHLAIFENLLESNSTILPKEKLFLITCSTNVKIYKKFGAWEVFVSSVQIELIESVSRPTVFPQTLLND